jgi:hypothetical protein
MAGDNSLARPDTCDAGTARSAAQSKRCTEAANAAEAAFKASWYQRRCTAAFNKPGTLNNMQPNIAECIISAAAEADASPGKDPQKKHHVHIGGGSLTIYDQDGKRHILEGSYHLYASNGFEDRDGVYRSNGPVAAEIVTKEGDRYVAAFEPTQDKDIVTDYSVNGFTGDLMQRKMQTQVKLPYIGAVYRGLATWQPVQTWYHKQ